MSCCSGRLPAARATSRESIRLAGVDAVRQRDAHPADDLGVKMLAGGGLFEQLAGAAEALPQFARVAAKRKMPGKSVCSAAESV
jgi:hypothetical protein